jgi:hypothetical protein
MFSRYTTGKNSWQNERSLCIEKSPPLERPLDITNKESHIRYA